MFLCDPPIITIGAASFLSFSPIDFFLSTTVLFSILIWVYGFDEYSDATCWYTLFWLLSINVSTGSYDIISKAEGSDGTVCLRPDDTVFFATLSSDCSSISVCKAITFGIGVLNRERFYLSYSSYCRSGVPSTRFEGCLAVEIVSEGTISYFVWIKIPGSCFCFKQNCEKSAHERFIDVVDNIDWLWGEIGITLVDYSAEHPLENLLCSDGTSSSSIFMTVRFLIGCIIRF